jgi:hypothetical protein
MSFRLSYRHCDHAARELESLFIRAFGNTIKADEYAALVTVLQHNTTLKMLSLYDNSAKC